MHRHTRKHSAHIYCVNITSILLFIQITFQLTYHFQFYRWLRIATCLRLAHSLGRATAGGHASARRAPNRRRKNRLRLLRVLPSNSHVSHPEHTTLYAAHNEQLLPVRAIECGKVNGFFMLTKRIWTFEYFAFGSAVLFIFLIFIKIQYLHLFHLLSSFRPMD